MGINRDHILTTHTGSLPRPDDLIHIMWAVGDDIPVDQTALSDRVRRAAAEVVNRQVDSGVSIINDGEMSKPGYATYVTDRLEGFNGETIQSYHCADLVDFPRSADLVAANPGRRKRTAPACTGPIGVKDPEAARLDMVSLSDAAAERDHGKGNVRPKQAIHVAARLRQRLQHMLGANKPVLAAGVARNRE